MTIAGRATPPDSVLWPVIHNCTREALVIDGHALPIVPTIVVKVPTRVVSSNPGLQKTMLVEGVVIGLVLIY